MRLASATIGLISILLTTTCWGDSLSDIYELALQNDPQLRAARAAYLAGSESENISRAGLLPQISAVGEYSEAETKGSSTTVLGQGADSQFGRDGDTDTDSRNYSITLTQPIFDLPAWFTFQQGKELSQQAMLQFSADQQALILRSAETYFDVLRARENLETALAEEKAIKRQLEQTRERFEVGLLPVTDVLEAQAAFDEATVTTLEIRGLLDIAFERLTVLTGQPHEQLSGLMPDFPVVNPEPTDREEWVRFSLQNNFSLQAAKHDQDAADNHAQSKKYEHMPTVTGALSYYDDYSESDFKGRDINAKQNFSSPSKTDQDGHSVAIRLNVPIFTGGLVSAERRQAFQQSIQAKENYIGIQRNTVQNARSLHLLVLTNTARVKARNQAIISAKSALEATQAGYEVGTRNIVDVLVVQRNLYQARRNYANSRYDYIASLLKLKDVAGQLSPDDIYQLNAWLDPELSVLKAGVR
ncbi:MAG: TolC family outer membrane protein [Porticoccus sp.]|nr:TolC family outer membrane protein [Porticoccus sp.]MBQ0807949.1 TolC family outer membrane protein [Porticoccus sp.]